MLNHADKKKGFEEMKKSLMIKQKWHIKKITPGYLFQTVADSTKLHMFSIFPKKAIKIYKCGFMFPGEIGSYHVENCFYFGGGYLNWKYYGNFRKVMPNGEVT